MKDIIARLKTLNQLDVQLNTIKKDMERLPREVAEMEAVPKGLRGTLERAKAEAMRLKMETDAAELEVKAGEDALKRLATQMNVLRTSKEWDTIRRQMDAQRGWNRDNETKTLSFMEQLEATNKNIEQTAAALAESEKAVAIEAARVEKELAELSAQYEKISAERAHLAQDIPDKELITYDRIAASRGVAISFVDRGICSACYMKIPPQIHNLALIGRELVTCPSCGRILTAGG